MDIEISKEVAQDAILWIARFLANNNAEPSMTSVQISSLDDNTLQFAAANIETYAECTKECHVNKTGSAIVNGRVLLEIVKLMPNAPLKFYTSDDDGKFHIDAKNSKHAVPLVRTEIIRQKFDDAKPLAQIKVATFSELLDRVSIAVAKDDATPILTAVNLNFNANELTATSIDRYRVARKVSEINGKNKDEVTINTKYKNISTIINGLDTSGELTFATSEDNHKFSIECKDKKAISVTLTGDFPETAQLFDAEYSGEIGVDRDTLKKAIDLASVVTEEARGIFLNFAKNEITITNNEEETSSSDVIPCQYDGEDIKFKFNPRYLKEGLVKFSNNDIRIKISESTKPVGFVGTEKGEEVTDFRYIVVPIRDI